MKTIAFEGYSDDILSISGGGLDDEVGCFDEVATVDLVDGDGNGLRVYGAYGLDWTIGATWVIGVQQLGEGKDLPGWPMRLTKSDRDYSCRLEIDCPDDVHFLESKDEDE